jgi:vacuolar-type H+-ATPase subunit I/STV1
VGARGRFLLDSIEDAEARTGARRLLASTDHVAAARVYVRPEDQSALRECLRAAHGDVVVLRPLAEADDAPSLPRRVAAAPFAAFRGLLPERFGDVAPSSLLALVAPLAVGVIWADVMGGLLLLLAGGLLGWRAGPGSPRRDTALLAQIGGFLALVLGMLEGRAAGALGASWLGTGWGLAPGLLDVLPRASSPWLTPFVQVLFVLGGCALVVALWGGLLALRAWQARRPARAAAILQGALGHALVAGLAAAAAGPAHPAGRLGLLAPLAALVLLLLAGPRRFVVRVALDLVGVLRLVAVAGAALVVFDLVLAGWVAPGPLDLTLGPLALLVAALAVVADPAHLAMGVPYDLSLGGHRLRRPFEVFGRRVRSGGEV